MPLIYKERNEYYFFIIIIFIQTVEATFTESNLSKIVTSVQT